MEKITHGIKSKNTKYIFRETSFGISEKNGKLLIGIDPRTGKYTFIGGGVEEGKAKEEALKREFMEEIGITIKNIKGFITIDCYWLAEDKYPMNSLANFFIIDIDDITNKEHELKYDYIDIDKLEFPLPYHQKAFELYKEKYMDQ